MCKKNSLLFRGYFSGVNTMLPLLSYKIFFIFLCAGWLWIFGLVVFYRTKLEAVAMGLGLVVVVFAGAVILSRMGM
jgi:hypothetical protein